MSKDIPTRFSKQQQQWYASACSRIDPKRLQNMIFALTDIHSPTGGARNASEFVVKHLNTLGIKAKYQSMSEDSGNVFGQVQGLGGGASVLLYSPIDTHLELDDIEAKELTRAAGQVDMRPNATALEDWVFGLGASNPKGMVATLTEVATALIEAEVPIRGDLLVGFADGGMPVDISARNHAGMSNGVTHLLARGASPDFAIVMKPWNWVYHEEPGMAWFKIQVLGTLGYAGVPHDTPGFRSSVLPAADVIKALESWLIEYADKNASGQIKPHGWIAGVRGGNPERPSFPSAVTEIFFDVRVNPRTTPAEVKAQFARFIQKLRVDYPGLNLEWEMYGSLAGGTTDPNNWIIQSSIRGWEQVEGREHGQPDYMAGQTDGAALRRLGIPTSRIGWPWPAQNAPLSIAEGLGGMGATYIPDLIPCAQKILYVLIDTLTREREELGL